MCVCVFNIVKVHGPGVVFLTFHSNYPWCDSQLLVSCLEFLPLCASVL